MYLSRLGFCLSLVLFVWCSGTVLAQESREQVSEARALFMAGRSAFDEGRYETALSYFQTSYEQSQHPALLYNVAQCYDRLRRDEEAIAAFEHYLAKEPDSANRQPVEARVRALREIVASRERAALTGQAAPEAPPATLPLAPDVTEAPPAGDSGTKADLAWLRGPMLTMGGGVVLAMTGGGLMMLASTNNEDVEHALIRSSYRNAQETADAANRQSIAGQVVIGVGAAVVAAGLTWCVLRLREKRSGELKVSLTPTGLRFGGRF